MIFTVIVHFIASAKKGGGALLQKLRFKLKKLNKTKQNTCITEDQLR